MIRVIEFTTTEQKQKGISGLDPIPLDAIFVFRELTPGGYFHGKDCQPFEITFLNDRKQPLYFAAMDPSKNQIAIIPPGAVVAVESAIGVISGLGFRELASLV